MGRRHDPHLLDNGVPETLKEFFPRETVWTSGEGGSSERANDDEVILLAHTRHSLLVTGDEGLLAQCRSYQLRWKTCLYGLVILPPEIELQKAILEDIRLKRKKLAHPQMSDSVAWSDVREENLVVITRPERDPMVFDLCNCSWPVRRMYAASSE
jgi:hypothetical protein